MAKRLRKLPIALTIAGSDSGGGAGIQADLKTFHALGVHGTTAITCVTAQTPKRVTAVEACSSALVGAQMEALFQELPPAAIKTGMLYSAGIVKAISEVLDRHQGIPLVVDPVMIATSGAALLNPSAQRVLVEELFPRSLLVTPNLDEAQAILKTRIGSVEEMRAVARALHWKYGCAALVKGGHLRNCTEAVDIFYDGRTELLLSAPFVQGVATHGTGCTYSAAIAAWLARGKTLRQSVQGAKQFISSAVANSYQIAGHQALAMVLDVGSIQD